MTNWNERFLDLAEYIAKWSKDTSVGTCAVIADDNHRIVSIGYNGFPSGADDSIQKRYDRPLKYKWTEHAERNAIYNAARLGVSTQGHTMYLMWYPCCDCARAILQSGIKKLVCYEPDFNHERWGEDFQIVAEMFSESNIKVEYIAPKK